MKFDAQILLRATPRLPAQADAARDLLFTGRGTVFCAIALLVAFSLSAQAPTAVPVAKEPHHHLVLENDYVRVFRVSIPGHDATLLHQHDLPYVYVALGAADVVNAVAGKPEARLVMADGQVGYSRGGFAHIARTDAGSPFNNVTIELLHPQGEPRNLCEKIIDGPFHDCQSPGWTPSADPPFSTLLGTVTMKPFFQTDEVFVTSFSIVGEENYTEPDSQYAQLLVVEEESKLLVEFAGKTSQSLQGGEVLWLDAGKKWTIVTPGEHKVTRFLLVRFKGSDVTNKP